MNAYMLDTTVFNHLVDGSINAVSMTTGRQFFVTHIQHIEIQNTRNSARLKNLLAMFRAVDPTRVPTASAVWGVSEYGESEWSSGDGLFESLLEKLNEKNKSKPNNDRDILIAETAIRHNFILVTDDGDLSEVVRDVGGNVIGLTELLSNNPHV